MGKDLFLKTNHKHFPFCQHCGKKLKLKDSVKDHLIPVTSGGSDDWDNCLISCIPCNSKKDNTLITAPKYGPIWTRSNVSKIHNFSRTKNLHSLYRIISENEKKLIFQGTVERCRVEKAILRSKDLDGKIFNSKGEEVD